MTLLTQAEFAREVGRARSTINELVIKKDYRIVMVGKKINLEESVDRLVASGLLVGKKNSGVKKETHVNNTNSDSSGDKYSSAGGNGKGDTGDSGNDVGGLVAEERRQKIRKLRIENDTSERILIKKSTAIDITFEKLRGLRDAVINVASRVSPLLMEKSQREKEIILDREINRALNSFVGDIDVDDDELKKKISTIFLFN